MILLDRDTSTVDALLTDLYLEALLAGRSLADMVEVGRHGRADGEPGAGRLDPAVQAASERLRRDLVRVHPSFRFEERLATRLGAAAVGLRVPAAVGAEGRVVPFRLSPSGPTASSAAPAGPGGEPAIDDLLGMQPGELAHRDLARPLLIGGALTSAALSLAGAALVAWRRSRPGSPMTRAARAVRAVRDARDLAGSSDGSAFHTRGLD